MSGYDPDIEKHYKRKDNAYQPRDQQWSRRPDVHIPIDRGPVKPAVRLPTYDKVYGRYNCLYCDEWCGWTPYIDARPHPYGTNRHIHEQCILDALFG